MRTANKHELVPVAALLLLGALAFTHLMAVPAFEDEGSQLRLIWRALDAGEWLRPLAEGKPLEVWPMVPLARLTPQPLAAIRALHVLAGMLAVVLTYRLALQVAERSTALVSGVLLAVCPFLVYLERLALADMLLCAAGVGVLLSVLKLLGSPTWGRAALLAVVLVLAGLCKLPVGFVFLMAMPLALLLMPACARRTLLRRPALVKVLAAHVPAVLLALAVVVIAVIRMRRGQSPGFGLQDLMAIGVGHYDDIASAIGIPRPSLIGELSAQLSWPVVILGLIGLCASALLDDWRQRWLIVVGAAPMLGIGWLATFWFSRYLLFTLPPLIIAAASGWHSLSLRVRRFPGAIECAVFALSIGLMGYQSGRLIIDPLAARWSPLDRFQYFEGWGSGYGYPEAAQFLLRTPDAPWMIYSLDGHSAYQLRTYLPSQWRDRVQPVFYGPDGRELSSAAARRANLLRHTPVWIVAPEPLLAGYMSSSLGSDAADRTQLRQIVAFDKPGGHARLGIYEVVSR